MHAVLNAFFILGNEVAGVVLRVGSAGVLA
jgi:NADPH:quinone reductase-like Zn-dependent oxidoreductase